MKKYFLLAAMAVLGIGVMMHSCKKDENAKTYVEQSSKNNGNIPAKDIAILNNIMNFKKKIDFLKANPAIKSSETMSVDSAMWYLDAAFNLTYSFIKESFEKFKTGTFDIVLNKTDGEVSLNDVSVAYSEMKAKTLEIYDAMSEDNKELYITTFKVKEDTDDHITLETTATIGSRGTPPGLSEWGPFAEGDNWKYGEKRGDCNNNWVDFTDGAIKIGHHLNTYRYQHIIDEGEGWHAIYTEPSAEVSIDIKNLGNNTNLLLNPNDDIPNDNYQDYLLMYQNINNGYPVHTCIQWDELNFYFHGAEDIIYDIVQDNFSVFGVPDDLVFTECGNFGHGEPDKDNPDIIHHELSITYKTRHIVGDVITSTSIGEDRD